MKKAIWSWPRELVNFLAKPKVHSRKSAPYQRRARFEELEQRVVLTAPTGILDLNVVFPDGHVHDASLFLNQADAGGVNELEDQMGAAATVGDFNGDGFEDLAVGAPGEGAMSGAVSIFFGSEAGLTTTGATIITQADTDDVGGIEPGDEFGAALAVGDFNGDLTEDLAVGAPGEDGSGAVFIFYGQEGVGLSTGFVLKQEDAGGVSEPGDRFGAALATGDFHGHNFLDDLLIEDLVVGAPGKDVDPGGGPVDNAGAVYMFKASVDGFVDNSFFTQEEIGRTSEADDQFGAALESGHFDGFSANVDVGNGFADLAVGTPGETVGGFKSGAVYTIYGNTDGSGLDFGTTIFLTQEDTLELGVSSEDGDRFGAALGVGDANDDGIEELAVGSPGENASAGAVAVFLGTGEGFTLGGLILTQEDAGGFSVPGDEFGAALALGVLDQNDTEELVVGAPGKDVAVVSPFGGTDTIVDAGAVYVFAGSQATLFTIPGFRITEEDAFGVSGAGDRFGTALTIEDFNDNNAADLAVGAPFDAPGAGPGGGAAYVFPGVPTSPPLTSQASAKGVNEAGDEFGAAQVTGDFNGDGLEDLAVGHPGEDGNSGAVSIFSGTNAVEAGIANGFFITQINAGATNQAGDQFGAALAAGDFNGDGFDDLAVGAPGQAVFEAVVASNPFVTPVTPFVTFQQGTSGYSGTVDTFIHESYPNVDKSTASRLKIDGKSSGGKVQALLRFDNIFGSDDDQVPAGSEIISATLEIAVTNRGNFLRLHRMLRSWSDTDTWNSLNAGISANGFEAVSSVDANANTGGKGLRWIDVTASVDAWATGAANHGWAFLPTGSNGVSFYSADGARPPRLIIEFGVPATTTESPVTIFFGSADGITAGSLVEVVQRSGAAMTAGDFNADGFDDLVVGAPGEEDVTVYAGSAAGITTGFEFETGGGSAAAMIAGDLNTDGIDDLIVGDAQNGKVHIFLGAAFQGITTGSVINQTDAGEVRETNDQFGAALTIGDFNADGFNDLAVGAPGKSMSGSVFVFSGSPAAGITTGYVITQPEIGGGIDFGAALAAGDFSKDGIDDLIVGSPNKDGSGAIFILPGSNIGLSLTYMGTQQGSGGTNEVGDLFGTTLAVGDFDADGRIDLSVGAPGEAPGLDPQSGAVFVFPNGEILSVLKTSLPTHHGHIRSFLDLGASFVVTNSAAPAGPPAATGPQTVTFQQGISGYSGTTDTFIHESHADDDNSTAQELNVDGRNDGGKVQGLLRFDNIFGSDVGQVPAGSEILSATLEVAVTNRGHTLRLHRMLQGWTDTDTWNSLNAGISANGFEAVSSVDASAVVRRKGLRSIDVTASVEAWANGSDNHGWAFLPTGRNGVDFDSAEGARPPRLIIEFTATGGGGGGYETVVATGNFDGDGFGDLIVADSGTVTIYPGSEQGITTGFSITQDADTVEVNEAGDKFGAAVLAGDFNADGFEDLIVGDPGEAPGADPDSGAIFVFYGSETGFTGSSIITQTSASELNEAGDNFGAALAAGDFNDDNVEDLAVGAPEKGGHGAVFVFYGTKGVGLTTSIMITQSEVDPAAGVMNEAGDQFGAALAAGDYTGEGFDDLTVGAPGKDVDAGAGPVVNAGAVFVFAGPDLVRRELAVPLFALPAYPAPHSSVGLLPGFMITQTDAGGVNEPGDRFGTALAAGDMNADDSEELHVGAPGKNAGAGAVYVFQGTPEVVDPFVAPLPLLRETVLILPGFVLTQEDAGELNEPGDGFGAELTMGDLNGDLLEDLIVEAPGKNAGSGAVFVFPGDEERLMTNGLIFTPSDVGGASFGVSLASDDFNDDNSAELVVAGPGGTAHVIPGVALAPSGVTQTNAGGVNEAGDEFGAAMAAGGNLIGDLAEDMVVGVPGKDSDAGAVYIFPGSEDNFAHPWALGITSGARLDFATSPGDRFGASVVVGDFNRDKLADLAVGAPGAGAVYVFFNSKFGLVTPPQVLTFFGVVPGDEFGATLVVGDFNGDLVDDLAVGGPGESGSGAVHIFDGSGLGLTASSVITQSDAGDADEAGDRFGAALAAGDVDGDGIDDLAVGAPGESPGLDPKSGAVFVFSGSDPDGLLDTPGFMITQTDAGGEANETGDLFGAALAIGDTNDDGVAELAVGAPGEAPGLDPKSGAVFIFEVGISGFMITQADAALAPDEDPEVNEAGDLFGAALTFGDFDADGNADLVAGAPGEAPGASAAGGMIFVFRGSGDGIRKSAELELAGELVSDFNFFHSQTGFGGKNEDGDLFGSALVARDFDDDGFPELAVGTPGEAPGLDPESGAVYFVPAAELGA